MDNDLEDGELSGGSDEPGPGPTVDEDVSSLLNATIFVSSSLACHVFIVNRSL